MLDGSSMLLPVNSLLLGDGENEKRNDTEGRVANEKRKKWRKKNSIETWRSTGRVSWNEMLNFNLPKPFLDYMFNFPPTPPL